jgi:hypothetical protein
MLSCQIDTHLNITFHVLWTGLYHVESLQRTQLIIVWKNAKHIRHWKYRIVTWHVEFQVKPVKSST